MNKTTMPGNDHMDPFVTLSGAALALGYINDFDANPHSLEEFEAMAEHFCNHTTPTGGKTLQAKYLEWRYYSIPGHPYHITANLSNILMARARTERFEEAIAVLKYIHTDEDLINEVKADFALFLNNNPKLQEQKTTLPEHDTAKPYSDGADIFQVLVSIEKQPELFGLNKTLDAVEGFIAGYKMMAAETKTKLKNAGKLDHFIFFLEKELNKPPYKFKNRRDLLADGFDQEEAYNKFFECFNKFRLKYKTNP